MQGTQVNTESSKWSDKVEVVAQCSSSVYREYHRKQGSLTLPTSQLQPPKPRRTSSSRVFVSDLSTLLPTHHFGHPAFPVSPSPMSISRSIKETPTLQSLCQYPSLPSATTSQHTNIHARLLPCPTETRITPSQLANLHAMHDDLPQRQRNVVDASRQDCYD